MSMSYIKNILKGYYSQENNMQPKNGKILDRKILYHNIFNSKLIYKHIKIPIKIKRFFRQTFNFFCVCGKIKENNQRNYKQKIVVKGE